MGGKKLHAAAIGVPFAVCAVWGFAAATGMVVPGEVAAAFGAVCTFIASVLIPDDKEE